ncbi:MAG: DsbE family thiol:disulfide interchange protein [Alphaproteobacteria bacterium]
MRWLTYGLPLVLFLVLIGLFVRGLGGDPSRVPSPLIGKPAPTMTLPSLDGTGPDLMAADLKGRVTLVNFFSSWCIPCRQEHPLLMSLAKRRDVTLIGIAYKDRREDSQRWLATLGNPFARIAADADGRVAIEWGVYGVPESYLIDRAGVIRHKQIGPFTERDVEGILLPLLKELSP